MKKRFLGILLSFALMLTMMPVLGLSQMAYAADETWSESFTTNGGTIDGDVYVNADITLTIPDGITLNVNGGISGGRTLTVKGKGTLIINGMNGSDNDGHDPSALNGGSGGVSFTGNIIVDGPTVTVTGGTGGIGGLSTGGGYGGSGGNGVEGDVTVNSGSIETTGGNGGKGGDGYEDGGGGGSGGVGITGVLTVTGGSATVTGGTGGEGGGGEFGGLGSNGADGITGDVTVTGGSATVTGGTGGKDGDGGDTSDVGKAVSGTITGSAEESDDNSKWEPVSGTSSTKQYVRVTPSVTAYPLWVGGTQVTSANADNVLQGGDNDGKVSFTPASDGTPATLTLNGATIATGHKDDNFNCESGIYYYDGLENGSEPLNIVLSDGSVNTVKIAGGTCNSQIGIYVDASPDTLPSLNISGKGQLTVSGSNYGINAPIITIDGCDVTASGGSGIHSYRGSIEIKGGSVYASATNYAIDAASSILHDVKINAGSKVTASGGNKAIFGYVKNAIAGTGWENADGSGKKTDIDTSDEGRKLTFKKVQFPAAHTHSFTYTASGATITAICGSDGCTLPDKTATLTITKPQHETYGDGEDPEAGIIDSDGIKGEATVSYYEAAKSGDAYTKKSETALSGAPTNAGDYIAEITLGADDNTATASVGYTIAQKPVTVSGITANNKTYDGTTDATLDCTNAAFAGKLDTDTLSVTATGTFADANVGTGKTVSISGLTLGGDSKDNYALAAEDQQTETKASIGPKSITGATVTLDKTQLTYNGSEQSVNVTAVTTSDGLTLKADDYTVSGNTKTDKGDYTATVEGKGNFKDTATADWKIVEKAMTVKADNVTVSYDGKEHGISVEVIDPASGAKVSYGTTEGTYDLKESPTIKEPGTLTVYFKAEAGSNYSVYTGKAVVTVEKAASTAAKVTANDREYDGTENELISVTGKAEGGEMQYALGNDAKTAPAGGWSTTIPKAANAGTYYVWYKVAGDEHHKDTAPVCVTVKISEKPAASKPVALVKATAKGKTALKFKWNKVSGAAKYEVWMAKCGKKSTIKKVKTLRAPKTSWTKKKLKKNTAYKFYVVAKDASGNVICKSVTSHAYTGNVRGKYTNAKSLKVKKSSFTLNKGGTAKIKATQKKARKGKKLCNHAKLLRYKSNNTSVAKVSSSGKITAVGSGTCTVYVQTVNGIWKTVKVTVK